MNNASGTCGLCHSDDFRQNEHKKSQTPLIYYTASELTDCAGSCHLNTDNTFTAIRQRKNGPEHNPNNSDW